MVVLGTDCVRLSEFRVGGVSSNCFRQSWFRLDVAGSNGLRYITQDQVS